MLRHLAFSQHKHTGQLIHHEHTSYLPLALVLVVVGFLLTFYTTYAASPGPQSGSIGIKGVMPGDPPADPPTITSPNNNQRFASTPVAVKGTCPPTTLVEVYKNDIFAGSTMCGDDSTYSFDIDLMYGRNELVARVYDALNQAGPDSKTTIVFYDVLPFQSSGVTGLDFGGAQLLLNTDAVFRGVFPDKEMSMPITIIGGRAPYAVNVQWGDSSHDLKPRSDNATFVVAHIYRKAGTYPVSLQATDADGRVAFITVAAVVNGQPDPVGTGTTGSTGSPNILLTLWPLYVSSVGIVASFWLGERREKHILAKHGQLTPQV